MLNEKEQVLGLTSNEALRRLKKHGPNTLVKKNKVSPLAIFIEQFNDFIVWVLIAATIISGIMGEKADAITIIIIIIMNAVLGFIQEYKTEQSLEALKNLAAPTAKAIRDGVVQVINAENIVIGDVILLESGDRIPADCILIDASNVMVDESLLTGESVGVNKSVNSKNNQMFMGTIVLTGRGKAKVSATGMSTEMGKIAGMLNDIESERSPLKEKLNALGKVLVVLCVVICAVVAFAGIMRGNDITQMFLLGVSLAVAAIPEGLPAIVTVALALGVSRMLKRNALVRKLPAVETLGCTSVICSDKTGTLTENNMTVKAIYCNEHLYNLDETEMPSAIVMKKAFAFCNDFTLDPKESDMKKALMGDPTETALVKAFFKSPKELQAFQMQGRRVFDMPFDSDRKMMSVVCSENGREMCYVKGAPERVMERCKFILVNGRVELFTSYHKEKAAKTVEAMSYKALRCIACAYKDSNITRGIANERELIFVGVAGIIDPPRREVKDAVLKCRCAGISPVMITGDHRNTAYAIAKELDICKDESQVMTGEELDKMSDQELREKAGDITVFARVSPNHKLRIVRAFKERNNIVAMTGDGVNDAPAVKEADIGISMGLTGTDVTKESAAMILLDDNFATIVAAVEEGRVIYDNIRKFIRYLLSCNLGEVLTMFLASIFNLANPLLPIQILLVNLATDGLPALALGVDPADFDVMVGKPRPKGESIFARGLSEKIVVRGTLIGICTVGSFMTGMYMRLPLETCRTIALSTLILSQLIHVFECRSEKHSIFEIKYFTNMYLVGAVLVSVAMLLGVIYVPFFQKVFHTVAMNGLQWIVVALFSGTMSLVNSLVLYFRRSR